MISKPLSVYLDIIRFIAAVLVLLYHSNFIELTSTAGPFSQYGHSAVIIFFVLSGFVIAYVTDSKEKTVKDYTVSRLARIYSVAIPVVLVTPFLDLAGEAMNPAFYMDKTTHDLWAIRAISSLLFLNEIWFVSIMSFSNVPYWSLCYEVWYYVLFAIMTFTSGKKRYYLSALLCVILGPKILLLFPIWYLGVFIYRNNTLKTIKPLLGLALWAISTAMIYAFHASNIQYHLADQLLGIVGSEWYALLTFSKYFLSDYLLAPLIALNFVGARACISYAERFLLAIRPVVVYLSGFTFILYLVHQPLLQFFAALIDGNPQDQSFYYSVVTLTILAIWALGFITEGRKLLWKNTFRTMIDFATHLAEKALIRKKA